MKLSQKTVNAFKPGARGILWDDELKGFGVRITEGAIPYIVDFRIGAKRRRVSLGSASLKTLHDARKRRAKSSPAPARARIGQSTRDEECRRSRKSFHYSPFIYMAAAGQHSGASQL
jgi:Arm DNA-binding domain